MIVDKVEMQNLRANTVVVKSQVVGFAHGFCIRTIGSFLNVFLAHTGKKQMPTASFLKKSWPLQKFSCLRNSGAQLSWRLGDA
jgi:hypothetical protein